MINEKGNNKDLVKDRVNKGKSVMANCLALCNEITMGIHYVEVAVLLYNTVFLSTIIFNSQAWTNLTKEDEKELQTLQLSYLKRILRSPQSTSNCFVFLETGILPIMYTIHTRQLSFLHHILNLEPNDPVRKLYNEQLSLPYEKNWGNKTNELLIKYNLQHLDPISMSKEAWKKSVKRQVSDLAFRELSLEAKSKSKTTHLNYTKLAAQPYIFQLHPKAASTIFKLRSRNIECKANRKSKTTDLVCRLCRNGEETQKHIVNCPCVVGENEPVVDIEPIMVGDVDVENNLSLVTEICKRIGAFLDKI
jgi:hypothetical protein